MDTPPSASLLGRALDARREELRTTLPIGRMVVRRTSPALALHIMTNTALTGATFDIDGGQQFVSVTTRRRSEPGLGGDRRAAVPDLVSAVELALAPQAGIAVLERASDGLLAAARIYDDIEPPVALR